MKIGNSYSAGNCCRLRRKRAKFELTLFGKMSRAPRQYFLLISNLDPNFQNEIEENLRSIDVSEFKLDRVFHNDAFLIEFRNKDDMDNAMRIRFDKSVFMCLAIEPNQLNQIFQTISASTSVFQKEGVADLSYAFKRLNGLNLSLPFILQPVLFIVAYLARHQRKNIRELNLSGNKINTARGIRANLLRFQFPDLESINLSKNNFSSDEISVAQRVLNYTLTFNGDSSENRYNAREDDISTPVQASASEPAHHFHEIIPESSVSTISEGGQGHSRGGPCVFLPREDFNLFYEPNEEKQFLTNFFLASKTDVRSIANFYSGNASFSIFLESDTNQHFASFSRNCIETGENVLIGPDAIISGHLQIFGNTFNVDMQNLEAHILEALNIYNMTVHGVFNHETGNFGFTRCFTIVPNSEYGPKIVSDILYIRPLNV